MGDLATSVLSSAAVSVCLTAAVVFLARTWIAERLKQSIRHEYDILLASYKEELRAQHDVALERLRAEYAERQAVQNAALLSLAEGHKAAHERRLSAIEAVWEEVVALGRNKPTHVSMVDLLPPEDFGLLPTDQTLRQVVADFTVRRAATILLAERVEKVRPFVGEYIYALFYAYRALTGRVSFSIKRSVERGEAGKWFEDPDIRQLIGAVLGADEVPEFDGLIVGKFMWLGSRIEQKILAQANRIISGEESGALGLEQAERITRAARKVAAEVDAAGE